MRKKQLTTAEVMDKLKDLCDSLTPEEKEVVASRLTIHYYKKNEIIYDEGERPDQLLCLISGRVKIYKQGVTGRTQVVRLMRPVEYFGYRAFFSGTDFITAAAAFDNAVIAKIPLRLATRLIRNNSDLAMFFIQTLAKSLGVADERMVSLTQKHIRGRLAESLLFLKESYGVEEDGGTLNIRISREDLANLSNMTTSNAIRTLSTFANEQMIAVEGRKIKILREAELDKISRLG